MNTRPQVLLGSTQQLTTGCGKMYLTLNPGELFIRLGKAGGCPAAQLETIGRLSALILRLGGTLKDIRTELVGIHCPRIPSCAEAIAEALSE